ncbi:MULTISPECIES: hypothetical protein [Tsukamurella]|uniref:DUF4832 domain-containing protein n=2 Tax=Tsukamurella TaxID=2060 RepID=A0A5C5RTZ1_9ACTN|nr:MULTISPECIES: hypothetical protein [Tsukamurella]NMD57011.1 hypothetical protein [Tsukamurella columbiensis]TWS25681.1 hypothetical protein FK530_22405 [Tsukamurella conjunctivitidis]
MRARSGVVPKRVVALAVVGSILAGCTSPPPEPGTVDYDGPDLVNPMRGQYENLLTELFPQASDLNRDRPAWPGTRFESVRIPWRMLQPKDPARVPANAPDTERYDFRRLDDAIAAAAAKGRQFGFRITAFDSCCDATEPGQTVSMVPDWLRATPGATTTRSADGVNYVLPEWNNASYLDRFTALIAALGRRYDRDERVAMYEMSGYGDFSENHVAFARDSLQVAAPSPETSRATLGYYSQYRDQYLTYASAERLVGTTLRAFPSTQIVSTMGNPAIAGLLLRDSPEVRNLRRPVGIRSDSLGALPILPTWAENRWSEYVKNRDPLIGVLAERFRSAPVITEWPPQLLSGGTVLDYYRRGLSDVVNGHVSLVSSTGFPAQSRPERMTDEQYALWQRATKYAGYRYAVDRVNVTAAESGLRATVQWVNRGSAPTYERWRVSYEVVTESGRSVARVDGAPDLRSMVSTRPYRDLTASPPESVSTDTVELPTLKPGRYMLRVVVTWDEHKPGGTHRVTMPPMQLAMQGRGGDGGYSVGWFRVD